MKKKITDKEIQELKAKNPSLFKSIMDLHNFTKELAEGTLSVLHDYSNLAKNEDEYAYIYIANKNDIQKFPEEISERKGDYYTGDFVFNDGCGFTKYKIRKGEYRYNCEYNGHLKGSTVILDIYLQDISETIYIDIVKNFIEPQNEIVVLLIEENVIRCIYSKSMISRTKLDRKEGKYCFCVEPLIPKFMPYLKPTPLKVVREIQ